jgi:hypothetical protein
MTGKGNTDGTHFHEEIYSFRRITLSPLILLTAYALIIYAIFTGNGKSEGKPGGKPQGNPKKSRNDRP